MKDIEEHKTTRIITGIICLTIIATFLSTLYYNIVVKSTTEINNEYNLAHQQQIHTYRHSIIEKYGIHPVVFECLDNDLTDGPSFSICYKIFEQLDYTMEEVDQILKSESNVLE